MAFCTVTVYQQVISMNRRQHCHLILAGILADPLARGSNVNRTIATIQNHPFLPTACNYHFISQ